MFRQRLKTAIRRVARKVAGDPRDIPAAPPTKVRPPAAPSKAAEEAHGDEPGEEPDVELDAAGVAALDNAFFVDIRERHEVTSGHVAGAFLLPMNQVPERLAELPRDRPLVIYCAAGARSYGVAHFLREQGIEQSWSLVGGVGAWLETGAAWHAEPQGAPQGLLQPVRLKREAGARVAAAHAVALPERGLAGTVQQVENVDGTWRLAVALPLPGGGMVRIDGLAPEEVERIGR